MAVAVLASLAALAAVLVAVYGDDPPPVQAPPTPGWGPLPEPSAPRRVAFPLTVRGYDPAAVDAAYDALAAAYADLYAAASPEVLAAAAARAGRRAAAARDEAERRPPAPGEQGPEPGSAADGGELTRQPQAPDAEAAPGSAVGRRRGRGRHRRDRYARRSGRPTGRA